MDTADADQTEYDEREVLRSHMFLSTKSDSVSCTTRFSSSDLFVKFGGHRSEVDSQHELLCSPDPPSSSFLEKYYYFKPLSMYAN